MQIPKYRPKQRPRHGQAYVEWRCKRYYLGPWGTPESHANYKRFVELNVWPTLIAPPEKPPEPASISIAELALQYLRFAEEYYGRGRTEFNAVKRAVEEMLVFDVLDANLFGPARLKEIRTNLVNKGLSRGYINGMVDRIRRIFTWAVENELVKPEKLVALRAVRALRRGKTKAVEHEPIKPPDPELVDVTIKYATPTIAAMIEIHRLTGMRSGELVKMRPMDINRSGSVWVYTPTSHKGTSRGRIREIPIGPRAQRFLKPYVDGRDEEAFCFCPREAVAAMREEWHKARKTPMRPSQVARAEAARRRRKRLRAPGLHYTTLSYRAAVIKAIERAEAALRIQQRKPKLELPRWHPHQLRHAHGTYVRHQFGLEAAQVTLGHAKADITQLYAARDLQLAVRIAAEIG